jgi:hypothetical protein
MSEKTIFDKDKETVTTFEEEADGSFHITKWQDVEPLLKINKQEYNSGVNDPGRTPLGRKVASIPITIWENWMKASNGKIQHDPKLLAKYLNDPDNKYFRTHNSVV